MGGLEAETNRVLNLSAGKYLQGFLIRTPNASAGMECRNA